MSEGEALILKKNSTKIIFDEKTTNTGGKVFLLTTKIYKNPNNTTLLVPNRRKT